MQLIVISPDDTLFRGKVDKVSVPTIAGIITLLHGHVDLVTVLAKGDIVFVPTHTDLSILESFADHSHHVTIGGGLCEISKDVVTMTIT